MTGIELIGLARISDREHQNTHALCEHAKQLGVKKFGPYYKVKKLLAQHNAVIRSSNYELTVGKYFRHHML
ncbi:hypothetical protein C6Y40_22725 [Alteromonas alba]|uniref:Uncharacterized protein n=1 Tax=Alteromonas alba TaxID=2079529 RepID=A0A2S9V4E4_9ALTE|nr:hypothetical protein C6Y40_22725 [Alteromonas alba]